MKQKNLVKKAVFPALVALLCSVIALTSVSYAWFTMGNTASVDQIELSVTSAAGMQVSATGDEGTFKSVIPVAELEDVDTNQLEGVTLTPVSTTQALVSGLHKFYTGTVEDDGTIEYEENGNAENFVYFDLYFKSAGGQTLYFDLSSTLTDKQGNDKDTSLAMRVSFVYFGTHTTPGAGGITGLASTATSSVIWNPNPSTHTTAAQNKGHANDTADSNQGVGTTGALANITYGTEVQKTVETVQYSGYEIADMTQGYHKVRVYIWIEGEDVDCDNDVSGGSILVDLKFFQAPTQAPTQG